MIKHFVILLFLALPVYAESRPNILFIMIDDLGWYDLNCQGNKLFTTPNIDKLAKEGIRFTDAYAASPVCSPTRGAAVTGLYPARTMITQHGEDRARFYKGKSMIPGESIHKLPPKSTTIAERLKKAGYKTSFIGKWHLSGDFKKKENQKYLPENHGFDTNIAGNGMGGPGGIGSYFAPYKIPNIEDGPKGEFLCERLSNEAVKQLTEFSKQDTPFFMCLWHYTAHWPIEAPVEYYKKYTSDENPDMKVRLRAMIESMDMVVGKTVAALDKLGLKENTLIVFSSDNGRNLINYKSPLRGTKGHLYEGGIRVPLIVRWPGKIKPGINSTPAITVDFAPTFMSAAGEKYSQDDFDGVSLMPLLTEGKELERDSIFFHYPHYAYHRQNFMGSVIRQGKYKLIQVLDENRYELYDLEKDPGESENLIDSHKDIAIALTKKLKKWKSDVDAKDPRPGKYEEAK